MRAAEEDETPRCDGRRCRSSNTTVPRVRLQPQRGRRGRPRGISAAPLVEKLSEVKDSHPVTELWEHWEHWDPAAVPTKARFPLIIIWSVTGSSRGDKSVMKYLYAKPSPPPPEETLDPRVPHATLPSPGALLPWRLPVASWRVAAWRSGEDP